jgi:hypothetical protein
MLRPAIGHARLMRVSTDRVEAALHGSNSIEQSIARRILEHASAWQTWEREHSGLMLELANHRMRRVQVAALKHLSFRLLHRRALFHHLRHSALRGAERERVMGYFRPRRHYVEAVVAEHGVYLRAACSYICTSHLGSTEVEDPYFLDPLQRYEELYAEYFSLYCLNLLGNTNADGPVQADLLPLLKKQLNEYRWAILDPRRAQPWLKREAELRLPTGDTQRLPALGPFLKSRV